MTQKFTECILRTVFEVVMVLMDRQASRYTCLSSETNNEDQSSCGLVTG